MTPANWGALIELLGAAIVAYGAVNTWREFAPGERLLEPIHQVLGRIALAERARAGWARLRRRGAIAVAHAHTTTARGAAFDAGAVISFADLPEDPREAIAALEARTRTLLARLDSRADVLGARITGVERDVRSLTEVVDAEVVRLDAQGRRVATGGVRLALVGAGIVAIGLLLQAIPA